MIYKPSKKLKPGMLCQKHGAYLIPARSGKGIVGVWRDAINGMMLMPDGKYFRVDVPAGLVVSGTCEVLAGKPK